MTKCVKPSSLGHQCSTQYFGVCPKADSSRNNKKADLNKAASPGRLCSQACRRASGIWELEVVIFICLYPNFLLRGGWGGWAARQVNETSLDAGPRGARKGEHHLQKTASCSWGILQGLHQTALLPDKKQNRPLSDGQYLACLTVHDTPGGCRCPGPA